MKYQKIFFFVFIWLVPLAATAQVHPVIKYIPGIEVLYKTTLEKGVEKNLATLNEAIATVKKMGLRDQALENRIRSFISY